MAFNPEIIFSFCKANSLLLEKSYLDKELQYFEVTGAFFESPEFGDFFQGLSEKGYFVSSVQNVLPRNIMRNLSSSSENIKSDIVKLLKEKILKAGRYNIKYLNFDLGLDTIRDGYEIQEITVRAKLIQSVMQIADQKGVTLCQPIRFPKAFPGSQQWKYVSMLINAVMHKRFCSEINIFPEEVTKSKVSGLLKKNFYGAHLIRFRYDPVHGSGMTDEMHTFWSESLKEQGYSGDLVFVPASETSMALKKELERLKSLHSVYQEL